MNDTREYQHNFSKSFQYVYDLENREKKAITIYKVLLDHWGEKLADSRILSIGASTGVIENYLADHCEYVTGIDIDTDAISFAQEKFKKNNLNYAVQNALDCQYPANSFDVILCNHIYEHVPDPKKLMAEIHRLLKDDGFCYFTAENRIILREPHHNLLFLSIMPKFMAHLYMRLTKKGRYYYETHLTYWGLKKLVKNFRVKDYSKKIVESPESYAADYMLKPGSPKHGVAKFVMRYLYWLNPTYIWVLEKGLNKE